MNSDHTLYRLADFPLLAHLAKDKTTATKLDGRACRYIYESSMDRIDPAQISEQELELIQALGIKLQSDAVISNLPTTEFPEPPPLTAEEQAWHDMPAVGREII